jgi:hypothetical protein
VVPFLFLWKSEEFLMADKPTYEQLEQRVKELEKESVRQQAEELKAPSPESSYTKMESTCSSTTDLHKSMVMNLKN